MKLTSHGKTAFTANYQGHKAFYCSGTGLRSSVQRSEHCPYRSVGITVFVNVHGFRHFSNSTLWLNNPLPLMYTKSTARVVAPPSTKISLRLNDLVGIKSCQHSLEIETLIVTINESKRMPHGKVLFLLELNNL